MSKIVVASNSILMLVAAASISVAAAEPLQWATEHQRDIAARLASAFAGTEICDVDIDPERVAAILRENFGERLTAEVVSDLMYIVVVVRAVQGTQVQGQTSHQIRERCTQLRRHFDRNGFDLKGVIR